MRRKLKGVSEASSCLYNLPISDEMISKLYTSFQSCQQTLQKEVKRTKHSGILCLLKAKSGEILGSMLEESVDDAIATIEASKDRFKRLVDRYDANFLFYRVKQGDIAEQITTPPPDSAYSNGF